MRARATARTGTNWHGSALHGPCTLPLRLPCGAEPPRGPVHVAIACYDAKSCVCVRSGLGRCVWCAACRTASSRPPSRAAPSR